MSKSVMDYSTVLSRNQILLAFGMLVAKELEKKGLIGREGSEPSELVLARSAVILELGSEAIGMALERRAKT